MNSCGPNSIHKGLYLAEIVEDYLQKFAEEDAHYLNYYCSRRTLKDAIEASALCVLESGKRCSHQYRISRSALVKAKRVLIKTNLKRSKNFDELHKVVESTIEPIFGIGELTIYDVAHRIGAYLKLRPEYVYLHAGTREGAKALKLDYRSKKLTKAQLPSEFRRLRPEQIEDCLCIYAPYLVKEKNLDLKRWKGKCAGSLRKLGCRSIDEYIVIIRGRC